MALPILNILTTTNIKVPISYSEPAIFRGRIETSGLSAFFTSAFSTSTISMHVSDFHFCDFNVIAIYISIFDISMPHCMSMNICNSSFSISACLPFYYPRFHIRVSNVRNFNLLDVGVIITRSFIYAF